MTSQAEKSFPVTVSVIMASYNCANFIAEAVESVISQSFGDWELIVSDDASTDGTASLAAALAAKDGRIRVLRSKANGGAARARNAAIDIAKGRYIAFLDSDDLWKPQKLERQLDFMHQHGVAFSFSSYERIDEAGQPLGHVRVSRPVTYHRLLEGNTIGCLTAVYDVSLLGKVSMPDIRKRQDLGLWLRLLRKGGVAVPLNESLAYYRVRKSSVSSNKISAAAHTWRLYRQVEELPLAATLYYFSRYALRGLWSHYGPRQRAR